MIYILLPVLYVGAVFLEKASIAVELQPARGWR